MASEEKNQQGVVGRLVVRMLAREDANYEATKPQKQSTMDDPSELVPDTGPYCGLLNHFQRQEQQTNANHFEHGDVAIYDLYLFQTETNTTLHARMQRDSNELIKTSLKRLEITLLKKLQGPPNKATKKQKKAAKSSQFEASSSSVWFKEKKDDTNAISSQHDDKTFRLMPNAPDMSNTALWSHIATKQLNVAISIESQNLLLPVELCPPTITSVSTFESFAANIFVGVPLVITTQLLFASRAVIDWYVDNNHLVCQDSSCFIPTLDQVGMQIHVLIRPIRRHDNSHHNGHGCEEVYTFANTVQPLPSMPIVSPLRTEWCQPRDDDDAPLLRVLSYNVLADQNASSRENGSSIHVLYPHVEVKYLSRGRRMPMIVYEILAYNADIICLQEVDQIVFEKLFYPVLTSQGYQGYHSVKQTGSTREGCAMFWSLSCFHKLTKEECKTFCIRDLFPTQEQSNDGIWKSMNGVYSLLNRFDNLKRVACHQLGHVLQVASLKLKRASKNLPRRITLANTHLFFHPNASHIRVMQLLVCCHLLHTIRQQDEALVFCGDFNSTAPHSGGYQLMFHRSISSNDKQVWQHLRTFGNDAQQQQQTDASSQAIYIPTLALPPEFPILCSGYPTIPDFTHYITGFVETLDYILASQSSANQNHGFSPHSWAPMPTRQDVAQHVAMPNEYMPSDHVSLVCDLQFTKYKDY